MDTAKDMATIRFNVKVPMEDKDEFKHAARSCNMTMAEAVQEAILEHTLVLQARAKTMWSQK